jgi:hypothetical protein
MGDAILPRVYNEVHRFIAPNNSAQGIADQRLPFFIVFWHGRCTVGAMKNLIVVGLALFVLVSVVACSDDSSTTAGTTNSSASMQPDAKSMKK